MTAYVDYAYYHNTFLGTAIASGDFAQAALRASAVMDSITFDRTDAIVTANTDLATIELIKQATCAVAEQWQAIVASGGVDGISQETVGAHTVIYNSKAASQLSANQKYVQAAQPYLASTGLLFPGFASGEYGGSLESEDEDE